MNRPCIVCGRPIAKRVKTTYVQPTSARGYDSDAIVADLRTKADCERHGNQRVVSLSRWNDGLIRRFSTWDGESYASEYFCTNNCAMAQGLASAQHGHRYKWHGL